MSPILSKKKLTKRGVCGARIDPILPKEEHNACMEFLVYVGNNSEVKMYVIAKYAEDTNLPIKYKSTDSQGRSVGK